MTERQPRTERPYRPSRPSSRWGRRLRGAGAAAAVIVAFVVPGPAEPPARDGEHRPIAIVIYGSFTGFSPHDVFHGGMVEAVAKEAQRDVDVRAEFVDATVEPHAEYDALVFDYLRRKYAADRVAVVVGVGARPIELATRVRAALYPSAGLVYGLADRKRMAGFDYGTNVTGVSGQVDVPGTVALATQLVPGTARIALVLGPTEVERPWYDRVVEDARRAAPDVECLTLFGLPKEEMLRRLATLPDRTVVVWVSYFRGAAGDISMPADVLAEALDVSNAPIFVLFDGDFGTGAVGGRLVDIGRQGEETGRLVARVVNGEAASAIPPVHISENPPTVDWRALQRWNIPERRLPDDAVVAFRTPTLWGEYGRYVVGGVVLLVVQTLLIVGLVVQRSRRLRTQRSLAERLRFERLFSDLSALFADLPVERIDSALAEGLEEIRAMYGADRASLVQFGEDAARSTVMHSATAAGVQPLPQDFETDELEELVEHVRGGESLRYSRLDEIPPALARFRRVTERMDVRSGIVVPLHAAGSTLGMLGMAAVGEARAWPDDAEERLGTLGVIFANAIVRKRAAAELHRSEEMSGAVLESIASQVCVLSRDGRIRAMNDAWRLSSNDPRGHLSCLLVGERCSMEAGAPAPCASSPTSRMRHRILEVIDGSRAAFAAEYRSAVPTSDSWLFLTVERFRTPEGGVVMTHQNITSRKRAELDAEQLRQELAHVSRVSTMGELAASIAHELNQPLTGVLSNAQAALRYLDHDPPEYCEVREILVDIIEDDRRAGEVIRRLRAMLQTGAVETADVDVNDAVADVARLLASDAALRGVALETGCAPDLPKVRGDHIQLKQVVLNLVVNAMDAMRECEPVERRVTIHTMGIDPSTLMISVSDRGPGIAQENLGRIFQPFFTTKRDGMGMGLSIARTIVEAHGGMLWVVNNPDRGASFLCRLPAATAPESADGSSPEARGDANLAAGLGA